MTTPSPNHPYSRYAVLILSITLGLGMSGCNSPDGQAATSGKVDMSESVTASTGTAESGAEPTATSSTTSGTDEASGPHKEGDGHDHSVLGGEDLYTNLPDAVWDTETEAAAESAAATALTAFLSTRDGYDAWWAGYAPLLESSYAAEAQYIDPERIALGTVGPPKVENPELNPIRTSIVFDTSAGPWEMVLTRQGDTSPWLVAAFSAVTS